MSHLILILSALAVAWFTRISWSRNEDSYPQRWQNALSKFLFGPLLLIMTAISIVCMGPQGEMVWRWEGWFSYGVAGAFLGYVGVSGLKLAFAGWRSWQQVRTYPQHTVHDRRIRLLNTPLVFSAQVGFWQPELVVSQGLLETLDADHLQAVLTHEDGHFYYRDTFWFFWLGWMRQFSYGLSNTEALWQELLLLREIRADQWAAQRVDFLLLAESLLTVVSTPLMHSESVCAAFSCTAPKNRLQERIEALLTEIHLPNQTYLYLLIWFLGSCLPLLLIPFHR
ncbi:MAG: M56 family metallopeptidase [Coleofasciculus sp. C1-SOL-03]|uniref:M56 family metallopeptidase n=1 Tax=Coleofasciculus sp. C1-SOL-03 TaxID=3069522 RepID=UPI0032FBEF68